MGDVLLFSAYDTAPNSSVTLHPEWGMREERHGSAQHHRSLSGRGSALPWSAHTRLHLPLRFVTSAQRSFVQALWEAGAPVALTLNSSHHPSTVRGVLANDGSPLGELELAYTDRWRGTLRVEARSAGRRVGRPFLLDDVELGLLDQPHLALG